MNKNIRVEVTQEDIDAGMRNSSAKCAGALAIKRAMNALDPTLVDISVLTSNTRAMQLVDDGETVGILRKPLYWGHTPTFENWIRRYDRGERVKPIVTIIRGI